MINWNEIIIHHSGTHDTPEPDTPAYKRYHINERGWIDIGYHFVVERIGGSYHSVCGRRLNLAGAHCPGRNSVAIGVCFAGDWTEEQPPHEQIDEGAKLIAGLCDVLSIPTWNIRSHKEYRDTECPGDSFPMGKLMRLVDSHRRIQ
jgi:hypothetical protein